MNELGTNYYNHIIYFLYSFVRSPPSLLFSGLYFELLFINGLHPFACACVCTLKPKPTISKGSWKWLESTRHIVHAT